MMVVVRGRDSNGQGFMGKMVAGLWMVEEGMRGGSKVVEE